MGLHQDASEWEIPDWERAQRRRISWALFMQEKWTALAYGRPSHISDDNWTVQDLSLTDFEDSGDETREVRGVISVGTAGQPHFFLMVELTKILSRVLSTFFTIRASLDQDTVRLFEKAQPLIQELAAWQEKAKVTLPMTSSRPRKLCSAGYVHLCYFGVLINVLRRLVRSTALAPLCLETSVLSTIRQLAYETAHDAASFISAPRLDQLESFWYFPSPYLFALVGSFHTLLLVTSLSATERDYWRETLTSLLWTLRVMSKASESMRYTVNRLEGGVLRGLEHALAMNIDSNLSPSAQPVPIEEIIRPFELAEFAMAGSDFGLESFDWLSGVQIQ